MKYQTPRRKQCEAKKKRKEEERKVRKVRKKGQSM
jgi:hypothetical protein